MSLIQEALEILGTGHPVRFHRSGETYRLRPISGDLNRGDIVLAKVDNVAFFATVHAVNGGVVELRSHHGCRWTSASNCYGRLD